MYWIDRIGRVDRMIVVWDLETTQLIDRRRQRIDDMQISVGCAECFDADDPSRRKTHKLSFWSDEVHGSHSLEDLAVLLSECYAHVAFNGERFDMQVMKKHFESGQQFERARGKLYDPYRDILLAWDSCSLAALLRANGLGQKSGKGCDAPDLWKSKQYDKLEQYCMKDVSLLADLITSGPTVRVPGLPTRLPLRISPLLFRGGRASPLAVVAPDDDIGSTPCKREHGGDGRRLETDTQAEADQDHARRVRKRSRTDE